MNKLMIRFTIKQLNWRPDFKQYTCFIYR